VSRQVQRAIEFRSFVSTLKWLKDHNAIAHLIVCSHKNLVVSDAIKTSH